MVLGDAFAAGWGASSDDRGWVALVADQLGWKVENLARKGAGYTATSEEEGCVHESCDAFATVLGEVETKKPDLVVVTGGRKDTVTDGGIDAARALIAETRDRYPDADLVVVPPLWDDAALPDSAQTFIDQLREATSAAGGTFLAVGQPLTGHPELIRGGADGAQPNDAGHQAIAQAVEAALDEAGLTSTGS